MARLVAAYPDSEYMDEIFFRRGEFFFVRKKYLDAEDAYGEVVRMGGDSTFYELALYKLGWTFYKQELYEEALVLRRAAHGPDSSAVASSLYSLGALRFAEGDPERAEPRRNREAPRRRSDAGPSCRLGIG